ncbi:hypothetical protein OC842_002797 [Tilletia horrida]|uniref:Histone H1 n=1 Tax=Tilletia horrida TaxID=155126 RepID=A0AAN6GCH3_9BASI|nr:hypothetical protein OC842_002797 [Tilletia horrida]
MPSPKNTKKASTASSTATTKKKKAQPPSSSRAAAASTSSSKPTYMDMVRSDAIREAIIHAFDNGEKKGVSRQALKSFLQEKYDVDMESNVCKAALKKALDKGMDTGEFVQPNGPSGKIKMAAKTVKQLKQAEHEESAEESEQENHKPVSTACFAATSVLQAGHE